jgi:hypothetical protein
MSYVPNMDAKEVGLYVDISGTLHLVACLKDLGFAGSADKIDLSTKCGDAEAAGKLTNQYNFTGYAVKEAVGNVKSFNDLMGYYLNKTDLDWVVKDTDEPSATYYRSFSGQLTNYNETANLNDYVAFEGTISIKGDIDVTA